jgi:hypothetical protein
MAAMREFVAFTTLLTVAAIALVTVTSNAFVPSTGLQVRDAVRHGQQRGAVLPAPASVPNAGLQAQLGISGLFVFGMGFGALVAMNRKGLTSRIAAAATAGKEVATVEKKESKLAYLEEIPKTIVDPEILKVAMAAVPKEQWDNPPDGTYLATIKQYADTYGPGKAMKMSWYDYLLMRMQRPPGRWEDDSIETAELYKSVEQKNAEYEEMKRKWENFEAPLYLPGPPVTWKTIYFDTGITINLKKKGVDEPFSGEIRTIVTEGAGRKFMEQWAWSREGLKPWQRGLEIGMAHGYFLVGPFTITGPLRATPEAATIGLLAGAACIGLVSVGGLLFANTIRPTLFDEEGDSKGASFTKLVTWHAIGGVGGAGFAHALITLFTG